MKIEIDKKYFIAIMATLLVIAGAFFVVSYGGSSPSVVGHSAGELEILGTLKNVYLTHPNCEAANSLTFSSECQTMVCGVRHQDYGGGHYTAYRSCTQKDNSCNEYNNVPNTCSNTLFGQVRIE